MLGTARTLRAHPVTLPSQALTRHTSQRRAAREPTERQGSESRLSTVHRTAQHSSRDNQQSVWQRQLATTVDWTSMHAHAMHQSTINPPTHRVSREIQGMVRSDSVVCASRGATARGIREFSSSGPRVRPPGAQPRLSQCGSRGLCAFNPYIFLNTTSAIYVGASTR